MFKLILPCDFQPQKSSNDSSQLQNKNLPTHLCFQSSHNLAMTYLLEYTMNLCEFLDFDNILACEYIFLFLHLAL